MSQPVSDGEMPSETLPRQTTAAQEQVDDLGGDFRSITIVAEKSGEEFKLPSVLLLDDDQLVAYEKLHYDLNQCDRNPDTDLPAQRFVKKEPDGAVVETEVGAHVQRGGFIQPYQKDCQLITPPYSIQLAIIFWGEDGSARFKKGGGRSAEIPTLLQELNVRVQERAAADSKSAGSSGDLASGADGDRG